MQDADVEMQEADAQNHPDPFTCILCSHAIIGGFPQLQGVFPRMLLLLSRATRQLCLQNMYYTRDAVVVIEAETKEDLERMRTSWRARSNILSVVGVRARAPAAEVLFELFYEVLTEVLNAHCRSIIRLDVSLVLPGGLPGCLRAIGLCTSVTSLKIDATRLVEHAHCNKRQEERLHEVVRGKALLMLCWKGAFYNITSNHFITRLPNSLQRLELAGSFSLKMTRAIIPMMKDYLLRKGQNLRILDFRGYDQELVGDIDFNHAFAVACSKGSNIDTVILPMIWGRGFWRLGATSIVHVVKQRHKLQKPLRIIVTNANEEESAKQVNLIWQALVAHKKAGFVELIAEIELTDEGKKDYGLLHE